MKEYLEQLFFDGKATKHGEFTAGDKKIPYTISTLSFEDQAKIDSTLANTDENSSAIQASHTYILELLTYTLSNFNEIEFNSPEECKEYLMGRSATLVLELGKLQGEFEKAIKDEISGENIDTVFSKTPSTSGE